MELNYMEIGRNIRKHRQLQGLKQKELARLAGVSGQHISHIENAQTKLSLVTLVTIANLLHIDCNTLLGSTLTTSRDTIQHNRISKLTADMDMKKLGLVAEFCDMLSSYDMD